MISPASLYYLILHLCVFISAYFDSQHFITALLQSQNPRVAAKHKKKLVLAAHPIPRGLCDFSSLREGVSGIFALKLKIQVHRVTKTSNLLISLVKIQVHIDDSIEKLYRSRSC
ncbi:hypothetical protein GQ457_16G015640 [Hibiscus cannabinus]